MNLKRCVLASLAIAVLVVGSAHGRDNFVKKKVKTTGSSVTCEATASAKAIKQSTDAIGSAVVRAFDSGCGTYNSGYITRVEVAYAAWAQVFAAAITSATASCTTSGNAYGCAAATSYASSISKATATAFVKAVAKAGAGCNCVPGAGAGAFAKVFGTASTFLKLTARASSSVSAAVCAKNGQAASATIFQACLAASNTKVFAKATASALAASNCYSSDALAKIKAETGSESYITEGCDTKSSQGGDGSGGTGSGGGGFVDVDDFLDKVGGRR